jgi:NAD(P)-dependent dehydrogenase (short-subunit alcohol dehydrogenase family)
MLNAAIMALTTRALTRKGHELQFATNHLGHVLLTALLLPKLPPQLSPARRSQIASKVR